MTDQRRAGWLRRRVRSSARLTGLARGVRLFVQGPPKSSSSAARPPASPTWDRIPELRTIEFRASSIGGDRLNLIVPTVQPAGVFGGVRTALDLFTALAEGAPKARIISLGPTPDPAEAGLPGYVRTGPADDSDIARSIVSLGDPATELAVRPGDVFVATYWTTAELTQRIRAWQATAFGGPGSPMVYLIQDYEPGFYPWSAQFLLARGTYADPSATLAIFNSKLLQDYLHGQGLSFRREFVFEPRLAEPLRRYLPAQRVARPRRILVYGRPKTPRNAFPLIVDGLRAWAATDPGAPEWSVVSIGQSHPDIDLGAGLVLSSRGKLSMDEYGALLSESAIGVSLMVSPHPSYPPLEMAHLGMLVLTNRFGGKDLASWHSNISSLEVDSAAGLAAGLADLCSRIVADPACGFDGRTARPDYLEGTGQFEFAAELRALLLERRPPEVG
jgi:hypothetical protein